MVKQQCLFGTLLFIKVPGRHFLVPESWRKGVNKMTELNRQSGYLLLSLLLVYFAIVFYPSLPLALTANLINRFFYLFSLIIRECLFGVNTYPSLPLALTANLINRFFYLFLSN